MRDRIEKNGIEPFRGSQWNDDALDIIKGKAVFATNSENPKDWFDSTWDDDVWQIDTTKVLGAKWFMDPNFSWDKNYKHIYTESGIPRSAIKLIKKGTGKDLLESENIKSGNLDYRIEHMGSHHGQEDLELGLYVDDEIIGMVQYTLFDKELTVSDIVVVPKYRRQGYGSRMMQYIKKQHPEYTYKSSMKTDLGGKFIHKDILDEIDRREDWKKEIAQIAKKLNVQLTKYLGDGVWGIAYEIPGNKVLKITEDEREINNAKSLVGKKNKLLADIYKVYSIKGSDKRVIIQEKLQPLTKEYVKALDIFGAYFDEFYNGEWAWGEMGYNGWEEDFDNKLKTAKYNGIPLTDIYSELLQILDEAGSKGINLTDMHEGNLGVKNGHLAAFDLS